ncbi:MAG: DUF6076 domain-containing protein [Eubacterium sp.]|nr:DUF6076 domain-containing protein [Eubacterium sp.]
MKYRINLTGKNSKDIYTISLPKNIINFLQYDFTSFMEKCTDLCKVYLKTGEYSQDEAVDARNSISGCHKYYEQNMRGIFDKIAVDCWIEYICRQNEIGTVTLWNNFINCQNDFEKAVFSRLNEYRHNLAHNQWVNILKLQEYAAYKVDFVFGKKVKNIAEASSKVSYFDLMFNVMANELGFDLSEIAENTVSSVGRTPNSPFTMSNVSREITRNFLSDLSYQSDNKSTIRNAKGLSDQIAMDAFSGIKAFLPSEPDSIISTLIKSMGEAQKVYIPASFKSVIDLEIDSLIEHGGVLQKCARCGEYFLRDENYNYDYCDKIARGGKSCLEKMNMGDHIPARSEAIIDTASLAERCDQIYKEMSERVNAGLTQRDFSDWYKYLVAIRENLLNGQATMDDFESFVDYSRSISFTPSPKPKAAAEMQQTSVQIDKRGREVRPFIFEKLDRNQLDEQDNLLYEPLRELPQPMRKRFSAPSESVFQARVIRVPTPTEGEKQVPYQTEAENLSSAESKKIIGESFSDADFSPGYGDISKAQSDSDIKIYEYEPPVKVYHAKENKYKRALIHPESKSMEKSNQVTAAARGRTDLLSVSGIENVSRRPETRSQHVVSSYRQALDPAEAAQKAETGGTADVNVYSDQKPGYSKINSLRLERDVQSKNADSADVNLRLTDHGSVERRFGDLLGSYERDDGFINEFGNSDEQPQSHKTKRVMDALFKPSKPSVSINIKNKDE